MRQSIFLLLGSLLALAGCFQQVPPTSLSLPQQDPVYGVQEDQKIEVVAPGVLAPFQLASDKAYEVRVLSDVFNGSLDLSADGGFAYTPNPHFYGTDSFLFELLENSKVIHTGTVVFEIENIPDPPIVEEDAYQTREDKLLRIPAPGILKNDSDPDGDELSFTVLNQPEGGTLKIEETGAFQFQPQANWFGVTRFQYQVTAGGQQSEPVSVTINVQAVNDRPRLRLGTMELTEGDAVVLTADHIMGTDVDSDDRALRIAVKKVQHGHFELKTKPGKRLTAFSQSHITNGNVIFKHNKSNKAPGFIVELSDGKLKIEQRMPIQFKPTNDLPRWQRAHFEIEEGGEIVLSTKHINGIDEETKRGDLVVLVKQLKAVQFVDKKDKPVKKMKISEINDGLYSLKHDGSEARPYIEMSLNDGKASKDQIAKIKYTAINDAPLWKTCGWEQLQGQRTVLSAKALQIQDDDNKAVDLKISLIKQKHLRFAHVDVPDTALHEWSYQAIKDKKIIVIHDNSIHSPSCTLQVSDGKASSQQNASIAFKRVYRPPTMKLEAQVRIESTGAVDQNIGSLLQPVISDVDGDALSGVEIRLMEAADNERITVPVVDATAAIQLEAEARHIRLSGEASLKDYQTLLAGLTYVCPALGVGRHQRRIQITLTDSDQQTCQPYHSDLYIEVRQRPVVPKTPATDVIENATQGDQTPSTEIP